MLNLKTNLDRSFKRYPALVELLEQPLLVLQISAENIQSDSYTLLNDVMTLMQAKPEAYFDGGTETAGNSTKMYETAVAEMRHLLQERISKMKKQLYITATIALSLFLLSCVFNYFISSGINNSINKIVSLFGKIEKGDYDNEIQDEGETEFGQIFSSLESMQSGLKQSIEKDRVRSEKNGRIKQALDNVSGNVMVTDAELNIIYFNNSMREMFAERAGDMRTEIADFDIDKLIGSCISQFHTNALDDYKQLESITSTLVYQLEIGNRIFQMIVNPVKGENGERIGVVLQWRDRTEELAVETEVRSLVNAALEGDLSQRIAVENKEGFLKFLSEGINNMVDVSERVINDTLRVLSAMARGDLTEDIAEEYKGAFGQLKSDANETIVKLTEIVTKIKSSSDLVNEAANEISKGNVNLSQRTEVQAANLEETSSNMANMTSTVQQNAENAKQANELAINTREQAENGGQVVNSAVQAMGEINEASGKISEIIGVIDEIAFQTNLLALNAAVEAARAGEQGRGFAVVASEVRNLAGRSATAAKEIKELIEDSVTKVEEGARLVNQSGQTLEEIMQSVNEVTDIIGNISEASQAQAVGIEQVNKAVIQMEESTQQNAALVEQASASAESMNEQSGELKGLVSFFNVQSELADQLTSNNQDSSQQVVRKERRSSNRPWSNSIVESSSSDEGFKQAVGSDVESDLDSDWEEF